MALEASCMVGAQGVAHEPPLKTLNVRITSAVKLLFGAIIFKSDANYFGLCYILVVLILFGLVFESVLLCNVVHFLT